MVEAQTETLVTVLAPWKLHPHSGEREACWERGGGVSCTLDVLLSKLIILQSIVFNGASRDMNINNSSFLQFVKSAGLLTAEEQLEGAVVPEQTT